MTAGETEIMPAGVPFPSFPTFTRMTRGLHGLLVIGGRPGVGKSTLAAQLAADVASEEFPGVYFDAENTFTAANGSRVYLSALRAVRRFGPTHPGLAHLYVEEDPSLDAAVAALRAHAAGFLVVDNVSSAVAADALAGAADLGAMSAAITGRMHQLNALAKDGYAVIALSHISRSGYEYGRPSLRSFMYSAAVEQLAWSAVAVWQNRRGERFVSVLKSRLPLEEAYRGADLRLLADPVTEALTEGALQPGGRHIKTTPTAAASSCPVVKALTRAGSGLRYVDLVKAIRGRTGKSRAQVEKDIAKARKAGAVSPAQGLYRLAEAPSSAPSFPPSS